MLSVNLSLYVKSLPPLSIICAKYTISLSEKTEYYYIIIKNSVNGKLVNVCTS